jgi:hypothetical protein
MWIILALAALLALWLFLTWYCADDQPMFGAPRPGRVTFKQVVQNFFKDVRETAHPLLRGLKRFWVWASPKVTNPTTWAAVVANAAIYAPQIMQDPVVAPLIRALLDEYPALGLGAALLALWATRSAHAPYRVPEPAPHAGGGLVSARAIT